MVSTIFFDNWPAMLAMMGVVLVAGSGVVLTFRYSPWGAASGWLDATLRTGIVMLLALAGFFAIDRMIGHPAPPLPVLIGRF